MGDALHILKQHVVAIHVLGYEARHFLELINKGGRSYGQMRSAKEIVSVGGQHSDHGLQSTHFIAEHQEILYANKAFLLSDKSEQAVRDLLSEHHHAGKLLVIPHRLAAKELSFDYQRNYVPKRTAKGDPLRVLLQLLSELVIGFVSAEVLFSCTLLLRIYRKILMTSFKKEGIRCSTSGFVMMTMVLDLAMDSP
jgi:hypothetical protein